MTTIQQAFSDHLKVIDIILSCTDREQLDIAVKVANNYFKLYNDYHKHDHMITGTIKFKVKELTGGTIKIPVG